MIIRAHCINCHQSVVFMLILSYVLDKLLFLFQYFFGFSFFFKSSVFVCLLFVVYFMCYGELRLPTVRPWETTPLQFNPGDNFGRWLEPGCSPSNTPLSRGAAVRDVISQVGTRFVVAGRAEMQPDDVFFA